MKKTNIIWKTIWKAFTNLCWAILGISTFVALVVLFVIYSEETCRMFIIPAAAYAVWFTIKYAKRFRNFMNIIATMAMVVEERVTLAE